MKTVINRYVAGNPSEQTVVYSDGPIDFEGHDSETHVDIEERAKPSQFIPSDGHDKIPGE